MGDARIWTKDEEVALCAARDRFESSYSVNSSGCWVWNRGTSHGYGRFYVKRGYRAHRVSYFFAHGVVPEVLDHLCDNKLCVNPQHLNPATIWHNVKRGSSIVAGNAKKECCNRGHSLSGDNLQIRLNKDGSKSRHCRKCARIRRNESKRRYHPPLSPDQMREVKRKSALKRWARVRELKGESK